MYYLFIMRLSNNMYLLEDDCTSDKLRVIQHVYTSTEGVTLPIGTHFNITNLKRHSKAFYTSEDKEELLALATMEAL